MTWVLENIALIFTLLFFLSIFMGALVGFIQGAYKNIYYLIVTLIIIVGGFFLIPVISRSLLSMDLHKIPFSDKFLPGLESSLGVPITSIKETLPEILSQQIPEYGTMFAQGSDVIVLANGIVMFALNIVLFILLLVLNATIFKLIAWIIWLFIRPKKKSKKSNELVEVKRKKYRWIGAISGAIRGFILLFILSIPLAGVISIAENTAQLLPVLEQNDIVAQQAFELSMAEDIVKSYRRSVMGKVYGIPIKEIRVDERIFDSIFQIRLDYDDGAKERIKLRREFNSLINIVNIVLEKNDYSLEFDTSLAFKFTGDDLKEINKNLDNIKLINVIKNVGVEFVYYELLYDNIDPFYKEYLSLAELKKIDLNKDLQSIIEALGIVADSENKEEILSNVFALKATEATEMFDLLGDTSIIKVGLTFGANMFFTSDLYEDFVNEYDLKASDITKPTPTMLINDFKNIVNIYVLAYDIGFTDQDQIINIQDNLVLIEDEHINELFNIVFSFSILYENDRFFASFVYDQAIKNLPDELKDFLTEEKIIENFNAAELSHLAIIGMMFLNSDLLGEGDIDYVAFFTEANINKLSEHISESNLLSSGIEHLLNVFLSGDELGFTIEIPEDVTFKGISGKAELVNLLNSARVLLNLDFGEGMEGLSGIDDDDIEEMAYYFSRSEVIAHNLGNIIESFTDETDDFQIEVPDDLTFYGEEGETEIIYIFKSLKSISEFENGIDSFNDLSDEDIEEISENLSNSKLIAHNISSIIESLSDEEDDFEFEIPDDVEFYGPKGQKEIEALFKSIRDISALKDGLDSFADMKDPEIERMSENFSNSKIIAHNLPNFIDSLTDESDDFEFEVPDDAKFYGEEGKAELAGLFKSLRDISAFEEGLDSFAEMEDPEIERMSENFSSSKIVAHNLPGIIESLTDEGDDFEFEVPDDAEFYGPAGKAELSGLFKSLRDISAFEKGLDSFAEMEDPEIDSMSENFSSSKIVAHNLPGIIESLTDESDDFEFEVPDDAKFYGEEGKAELSGLFKSLRDISAFDEGLDSFAEMEDPEIDSMSENFSSSKIVAHNLPGIIESLTDEGDDFDFEVPDEAEFYGDDGKKELGSLFRSLRDISALDGGTGSFEELTDPEIDSMSENFSSSVVISHNLPGIIDSFTKDSEADNGFKIIQPDDVTYKGEEGKTEIAGLFKSFRDIAAYDIGSEDGFKNIEDEEIETMSENFASSKIITYNLTGIVNSFTKGTDYDFIGVSEDEDPYEYWTQGEIENTFKGVSLFAKKDLDSNNLYGLDADERRQIALSVTFAHSIRDMLIDKSSPGGSLEGQLYIPEDLTYYTVIDENDVVIVGEVEYLFKGLDIVLGDGEGLDDLELNLTSLKDVDLEDIFESKILEATAVEIHIKKLVKVDMNKYFVDKYKDDTEFDWYMNENPQNPRGDTIGLIESAKKLDGSGLDIEAMNYTAFKTSSDDHTQTVNMTDALISSNILRASLYKLLNEMLVVEGELDVTVQNPDKEDLDYWGKGTAAEVENQGELYFILDALSVGDGFAKYEFDELDSAAADGFKVEVKKINRSETLRPILADMLDEEPLIRLDNYRYVDGEAKYQDPMTFNEQQWDGEIDRLIDIMVILNDFDITNPLEPGYIDNVYSLRDKMEDSILFDEDKLIADLLP